MADFKQNYFQRRTKGRGPRSNNRITSSEVQVINSDDKGNKGQYQNGNIDDSWELYHGTALLILFTHWRKIMPSEYSPRCL